MQAIQNKAFHGTITLPHETADTILADLITHGDMAIESIPQLTLPRVEGGYYFSYTFPDLGYYKIRLTDSFGNNAYTSIVVEKDPATSEEVTAAKEEILGTMVVERSSSVYIKQNFTADYTPGGAIGFTVTFTPNAFASDDEITLLAGEWQEGVMKNVRFGPYDSTAVVSDIYTYTNGVVSIFATTSDVQNYQGDDATETQQWQVTQIYNDQVQDPTDLNIPLANREALSIRNYTVGQDDDGNYVLTSGDVVRTVSAYGSVSSSDLVIGTITASIPSSHAYITYTVSKQNSSDTVVSTLNLAESEDRETVQRALHQHVIQQVNNHASFNGGLEWTYDAVNYRINTQQPFLTLYDISMVLNNTTGSGDLGIKSIELVETTALLSSGLSEDERTRLYETSTIDSLAEAKTDIISSIDAGTDEISPNGFLQ